ncbi:hypothetical protein RDV89_04220 [Nocardioides zeae]|uniref:DUF6891 domain-containing protein n=1 Tax=Nocardioides imazamoxiresistens TaxID=3231893 RepID=A0ABU3PTT5_9ACTN|nr:hypothetical protein [Nocardioides zeae]MDT9592257.1 hypothetical protein [Nocardioides zeae]
MTGHPALASTPSPDESTFAGWVMLQVAIGLDDRESLRDRVDDLVVTGEFAHVFPGEPALDLDAALAVVDEVIAAHDRLVTEPATDTIALVRVLSALPRHGIALSFGAAFDAREAARDGYAAALALADDRGAPSLGYVYAHTQDLARLVVDGVLVLGFSDMSGGGGDPSAAVGQVVTEALRSAGLQVDWNGDPRSRLAVGPLVWARPFDLDAAVPPSSAADAPDPERPTSEGATSEEGEELLIDLPAPAVVDLALHLGGRALPDDWEHHEVDGVEVASSGGGHLLYLVGVDRHEDPSGEVRAQGEALVEEVLAALTTRLGAPERRERRDAESSSASWVDVVMGSLRAADAQVWAIDDNRVVVLMRRRNAHELHAALAVCPRSSVERPVIDVLSVGYVYDEVVEGETFEEVRRRARVVGERTGVPSVVLDGVERHGWRGGDGRATAWYFTADGRALLTWFDPCSELADVPARGRDGVEPEAYYGAMFDGVPDDLRAAVTDRPGDLLPNTQGSGTPVHLVTGVFWFDGLHWRMADGWLRENARRDDPDPGAVECLEVYALGKPFGFDADPTA